MDKKQFKKLHRQCSICDSSTYEILDIHRIEAGKDYSNSNCLVLCANCHRLHHAGNITIKEKRYSTDGWILIYVVEGIEYIKKIV